MALISSLGARLRRNAVRKGFLGGRRPWLVIGVLTYGWRFMRRVMRPPASSTATEMLKPGEAVVVESLPKQRRRGRRSS